LGQLSLDRFDVNNMLLANLSGAVPRVLARSTVTRNLIVWTPFVEFFLSNTCGICTLVNHFRAGSIIGAKDELNTKWTPSTSKATCMSFTKKEFVWMMLRSSSLILVCGMGV